MSSPDRGSSVDESQSSPDSVFSELGVAERIRRSLGELSKSERKVARALLSGPPTIGLESVTQLAQRADVSGPTVSRFVARLGFDNYAAFQQTLREDLSARVLSPVQVYRSHLEHPDPAPLDQAAAAMTEAVTRTLTQLSSADFERATALCADTRHRLLVAGGWSSHLLAALLTSLLRPFRPGVLNVPPVAAERTAGLADLARRDVVVLFDFRRYELDTFDFARLALDRGARTVLITDPWLSPIADLADAVLPAQVDGPSPFENLTPTLALVETLTTAVARRLGADGDARLDRFGAIADHWVRPYGGDQDPPPASV
jgi:DNA-binding MurR/RpiR family transcriptional regulator